MARPYHLDINHRSPLVRMTTYRRQPRGRLVPRYGTQIGLRLFVTEVWCGKKRLVRG